jgi:hypothetical protein
VDGIPVFILAEKEQTIGVARASYDAAESGTGGPLYLNTIGLSDNEIAGIEQSWASPNQTDRVDPAISYLIGATCGLGYVKRIGRLNN